MLRDFRATASLVAGGGGIDVAWRYTAPGAAQPPFRLVRRRGGPPAGADDGEVVADFAALYRTAAPPTPWQRIERWRMVTANGPAAGSATDAAGGDEHEEATLDLFFAAPAAPPTRAVVRWWDGAAMQEAAIDDVSRVVVTPVAPAAIAPPFTEASELEIFATPGGGPEASAGIIRFSGFAVPPADPVATPSRFDWTPAAGPAPSASYHVLRRLVTLDVGAGRLETRHDAPAGTTGALAATVTVSATPDLDAGTTRYDVEVRDRGLAPGVAYYYRLFSTPAFPLGTAVATATAVATGSYGTPRRLFELLPPVHQLADRDTPAPPALGGRGQLERFLTPFGAALDHLRGLIDTLPARHDVDGARLDLVPHLARMIGWSPDVAAPAATQRQDVAFAPALFATVGTPGSPPAIVNRVTGWPCAVKEYVNNVLLTNAPETVPVREIWRATATGAGWSAPAPLTLTAHADADPVVVEAAGTPWVVFHSDRGTRRELWYQRVGVDAAPQRVMGGAPDDAAAGAPPLAYADETPAALADGADVVLFWSSTRAGSADLWTRTMTPAPGAPTQLTSHPRTDREPAIVATAGSRWLFWSSDRRGPWDIWAMEAVGAGPWGTPVRLAKAPDFDALADGQPNAIVAPTGDLWLFWCRDMGDRREIWHQVLSGGVWGAQQSLSAGLATGRRDEAPFAVVQGGEVWLLFHSDRGGPWQIWRRRHDGVQWLAAERLSAERTADTEPTAFVDGVGDVTVFWTSERRTPWYRSRTLDLDDVHMLGEMGTFADHTHYVYDTGEGPADLYARGTVGLFPTPDTADPAAIADGIQRAAAFLEPFRPAPVRFVWPDGDVAHQEPIEVGGRVGAPWQDGA